MVTHYQFSAMEYHPLLLPSVFSQGFLPPLPLKQVHALKPVSVVSLGGQDGQTSLGTALSSN